MKRMGRILVLNMGMKSIRSIVFDQDGNKVADSFMPIETLLQEEKVTQNPREWWEKGCNVIAKTVEMAGSETIDYITVTASASCMVCVDKECEPLLPCMMVSDRRARKESGLLKKNGYFPEVYQKTGLDMDPYLMLPRVLWVKNNMPEIFEKTYKFLAPNDYLIVKLSGGCAVTDYINAQKWHYLIEEERYPTELIEDIGISDDKLPTVVSPGTFIGHISAKAADETGLSTKTKIIVSTYDAICSFIGSGISQFGEASDVSGTVTVFRTAFYDKPNKSSNKIQQIPFKEAGLYIVGGSNNMGGGLIEWTKQCYYQSESLPYELMEKDAKEAGVGAGGLIFLPYLMGERAPIWDCDARGVFFGLERIHTRKEMTRAIFESTGFINLDMIEAIEEIGGRVDTIRLSGGLARIGLMSQIKADITGRDVEVLEEFETTSSGAAIIALYGQKIYASLKEAAERFSRIRMNIKPNRKNHEEYQRLYGLYKETYRTLKPLFSKRIQIVNELLENKKDRIENL